MARGEKPAYRVMVSRQVDGKNFYTDVGAAWRVANDGISIQLQCLPVDGKLILFPPREED